MRLRLGYSTPIYTFARDVFATDTHYITCIFTLQMIENGKNRMDCKFVHSQRMALRRNTDPRMKTHKTFGEHLSVAFLTKKNIRLAQHWAVGVAILELSKYIMQSLYYKAVKPAFNGQTEVIMSDTDSWILAVPTSSPDEAAEKLAHVMDFSNYSKDHRLYDASVKNRTGFLKNEIPDDVIVETVAIRSKIYAYKTLKMMIDRRCKGVKRAEKDKIPFQKFLDVILNGIQELQVEQYTIQSKGHVNRSLKCKKRAFSSFDDKRYLLCAIHSVPYGSVLIKKSKKMGKCFFCANPTILC